MQLKFSGEEMMGQCPEGQCRGMDPRLKHQGRRKVLSYETDPPQMPQNCSSASLAC